ncbi:hypothetical protein QYE76_049402 [Lolium multiflorum]|uniref:Uncharacterized protein n=1 Tax=Lolium multiflorum TaxID=4521 RepID=A0AAD8SMZ1_LOLMU|nr:hypothetical protein QYE76_049402 [Lolium multiflorum]
MMKPFSRSTTKRGVRPSPTFYVVVLSMFLWALIFSLHCSTSLQSGDAIKPSAFLSFRFGRPDQCAGRQINSSSIAAATRPPSFDGMHYKRWRTKAVLWFTNLGCFSATDARPEGPLSAEEQGKFEKVDAMFKAALFSILGDNIVDPYMAFDHGKDAWDALEAKFGVSDAGTELYVMEQYYDYRMTDERSVVEQAHEIQSLAKELEQFKCCKDFLRADGKRLTCFCSWCWFWERSGATTGSTTSSSDDEFLHTDNFFPDLSDFFDNLNMGDNDAAAK